MPSDCLRADRLTCRTTLQRQPTLQLHGARSAAKRVAPWLQTTQDAAASPTLKRERGSSSPKLTAGSMEVEPKVQEGSPEVPNPPTVKTEEDENTIEEDGEATQAEKRQKKPHDTSAESFAERLVQWELCMECTRPSTLNRSSPQGSFPGQDLEAEAFAKECHQEGDSQENTMAKGHG